MSFRILAVVMSLVPWLAADRAMAESKLSAFIVGIGEYQHLTTLSGPVEDARKIEQQLSKLGYRTVAAIDPSDTTRTSLAVKWQKFLNQLQEGDDAVVYYSGHAVEVSGTNYLVPIDTPAAEEIGGEQALKTILIALQTMMSDLSERNIRASVWVLDACRDNPFVTATKSIGGSKGLGQIDGLGPMFIFYAANYRQTALARTQQSSPNSLYTWALADLIGKKPNAPVAQLATEVRATVKAIAKAQAKPHDQRPAYYDGLDEPWCFAGCSLEVAVLTGAKYETISETVVANAENMIKEVVAQASKNVEPNAVYLGKESAKDCVNNKPSGLHPFGCPLLRDVAAGDVKKYIGTDLKPLFHVNVRKTIPAVDDRRQGIYSCPVQILETDQSIKLVGVTSLPYGNDIFYWGTVAGPPKDDCLPKEAFAGGRR
jgi:Caspase domain